MSQVADLLTASRAAHQAFRDADALKPKHPHLSHHGHPHRVETRRTLRLARDLRLQAHALDPTHADPAWTIDAARHDQMLAFYDTMLASFAAPEGAP